MPRGNINRHIASAPLHHLLCLNADPVSQPGRPWACRHFTLSLPVYTDPVRHTGRPWGSFFRPFLPLVRTQPGTLDDRGSLRPPLSPQMRTQPGMLDDRGAHLPPFFPLIWIRHDTLDDLGVSSPSPSSLECGSSLAYWTTVGVSDHSVSLNTDLIPHRRRP